MSPAGNEGIQTLEPLIEAVRRAVEGAGWGMSGLQKTTSHEFEGRWAGESTRSAYLFFHREDLPGSVSIEAFLDETSAGLRGNLALVLDGPRLARLGSVREVLERVASASEETLREIGSGPVSLRLMMGGGAKESAGAEVQFRIKLPMTEDALAGGNSAVASLTSVAVSEFEALLERPEVAELLPPLMD